MSTSVEPAESVETEEPEEPRPRRAYSVGIALDWYFFVFAGLAAIWLAYLSAGETFRVGWWGIPFAAIFIFFGHNWARVLIMIVAVVSISATFVAWAADEQAITLEGTFFSLGLDVLLLLALSSRVRPPQRAAVGPSVR